jgi:NADPH-dependent 7-cyano-7-deazaguanine reductase QueF
MTPANELTSFEGEYEQPIVTELFTDELTALCPFDFGGPDFYDVTVRYRTDGPTVESKSWKKYVQGFRDREITAEKLADTIRDDVAAVIGHDRPLHVRVEQARRGGTEITVEAGTRELRE